MSDLASVLARGRQAVSILEAPPGDPDEGYGPDELAAQYAATDRLVAAFRELDTLLVDLRLANPRSVNCSALFNT